MKIDLSDKIALVTTSSSGIGYAIAKGLAESGAMVILNGRNSLDSPMPWMNFGRPYQAQNYSA